MSPEEPADALPPNCIEAEKGLIGCLLLDSSFPGTAAVATALQRITDPEMWFDIRHRSIYSAIVSVHAHKHPVTPHTVLVELQRDNPTDQALPYLVECMELAPSPGAAPHYLDVVVEKYRARKLIQLCLKTSDEAYKVNGEGASGVIAEASKAIARLRLLNHKVPDDMDSLVKQLSEQLASGDQTGLVGLNTGFPSLDAHTLGLKAGEFWVVGARPSIGKTTLLRNIAVKLAVEDGVPSVIYSFETRADALLYQIVCTMARVNARDAKKGDITDEERSAVTAAMLKLKKSPLYIVPAGAMAGVTGEGAFTVEQLQADIERRRSVNAIGAVFVDYIQLVPSTLRYQNRSIQVGEVTSALKSAATQNNIPIMAAAQLNRESEKDNRQPILSDLRESGSIEADADVVALLHRPKMDKPYLDLCLAKIRCASPRTFTIEFDRALGSMAEVVIEPEDQPQVDNPPKKARKKHGQGEW